MLDKILIAFDGSEQSKRALHYALVLTEKFSSELIILTVYNRPVIPVFGIDEDTITDPDFTNYIETMKRASRTLLNAAEEIAKRDWPSVNYVSLIKEGRPASMIMSVAENEDVDLVILGDKGVGGVSGWVLGSTSKSVVDNCKKPVLVVK
jgi:nucleotide-binding universal stress UspA family protein